MLRALAWAIVKTAHQPDAHTVSRRPSVPGIGKILALVLLSAIHDRPRVPRGQEFVASGRVVKGAQEAAGTRYGTSGTTIGHASLQGAFSEAAGLFLQDPPRGQKYLPRWEKTHGQGKALTVLAHQLARAVEDLGHRDTAFNRRTGRHEEGSGVGAPVA